MNGERNKVIWAEVVARTWRDEAYKQQLLANPKQVLIDAGASIPESMDVQILSNTDTEKYVVLPNDKSFEEIQEGLVNYLKSILPLLEGVQVILRQSTASTTYVALPTPPTTQSGQRLSEDELDMVAGGDSTATTTNSVQTVEAVTTEVEATETTTTTTAEAEVEVAAVGVIVLI